jgi:hypothetical protein
MFFLSYSSHDNEDPKKWVVKFHNDLEKRLLSLSGRKIKVLLDKYDLDGNVVGKGLEEMIDNTEGLVTIVSPSYLSKEWCTWERELFLTSLKRKFPEDNPEERLFVAMKLPKLNFTQDEDYIKKLPKVFWPLKHYRFFYTDEHGHAQELSAAHKEFKDQLNALAHTLITFLDKNQRPAVYLALVSSRLQQHRVAIHNELTSRGFIVHPRLNHFADEQFEREVDNAIKRSILSIHLIDPAESNSTEGPDQHLQIEIAQRYRKPMLLWCQKDTTRGSIWQSPNMPNLDGDSDLIESDLQDFVGNVFEKLNDLSNAVRS